MSDMGVMSSQMIAIQQMQLSLIKNGAEMQQKVVEVLLGDDTRAISHSDFVGTMVDVSL